MRDIPIEPDLWRRPDMLAALAARDVGTVYRLLQRVGVSQRRIAAMTGQSQSEISEILGGRRVSAYDVLVRIAEGLGIPRGRLGLAHDEATQYLAPRSSTPTKDPETGRWVIRLPVLVDDYAAALNLADSIARSMPWVPPNDRPIRDTSRETERQWLLDGRRLLASAA